MDTPTDACAECGSAPCGCRRRGRCCRPDSRMQTQLNIRLSNDEKALLERRARDAGLTVSQFVRQAVLGEAASDDAVSDPPR